MAAWNALDKSDPAPVFLAVEAHGQRHG
jgi:hypothetical protein